MHRQKPFYKRKWFIISAALFATIFFLVFFGLFVVFPLVFQNNISVQRFFVFWNLDNPKEPEYGNYAKYGIKGVKNFYVNIYPDTDPKFRIGAWHVLPESLVEQSENDPSFDFNATMKNSTHDMLLFFHGVASSRITNVPMYKVLRNYFQIMAIDYRDFADSTSAPLGEDAVVSESVLVYKWLREQRPEGRIYVWGHSMGTAISTHTVARLRDEGHVPNGLMLEAPFTSLREELEVIAFLEIFRWLAWWEATMVDPLEENGFVFKTKSNILRVNPPIMILHAQDDNVLPIKFGRRLAHIAENDRNMTYQGRVRFHELSSDFRHGHTGIYSNPELRNFVEEFKEDCEEYEKEHNNTLPITI